MTRPAAWISEAFSSRAGLSDCGQVCMGLMRLWVPGWPALQIEEALAEVAAPPVALVRDATEDMALGAEEQLGPVRTSSPTGTSTRPSPARTPATSARRVEVAGRLGAGTVRVDQHPMLSPDLPLGGLKQSGLGAGSALHGLLAYTDISVLRV